MTLGTVNPLEREQEKEGGAGRVPAGEVCLHTNTHTHTAIQNPFKYEAKNC